MGLFARALAFQLTAPPGTRFPPPRRTHQQAGDLFLPSFLLHLFLELKITPFPPLLLLSVFADMMLSQFSALVPQGPVTAVTPGAEMNST